MPLLVAKERRHYDMEEKVSLVGMLQSYNSRHFDPQLVQKLVFIVTINRLIVYYFYARIERLIHSHPSMKQQPKLTIRMMIRGQDGRATLEALIDSLNTAERRCHPRVVFLHSNLSKYDQSLIVCVKRIIVVPST